MKVSISECHGQYFKDKKYNLNSTVNAIVGKYIENEIQNFDKLKKIIDKYNISDDDVEILEKLMLVDKSKFGNKNCNITHFDILLKNFVIASMKYNYDFEQTKKHNGFLFDKLHNLNPNFDYQRYLHRARDHKLLNPNLVKICKLLDRVKI